MLNQPVAILGGGNAGHTMAADLTLGGYKVNFYEHPRFEGSFKSTLEKRTVEIEDQMNNRLGLAKVHSVTTDMRVALSDAKLIFLAVPSFGQELFFNTMIPHLKDEQVVFVMTGNFGSLRLRKLLSEKKPDCKATIYETCTMPYGTRLAGPSRVGVQYGVGPWIGMHSMVGFPERVRTFCALPAKYTNVADKEFRKLYPHFTPVKNVLVSALNSANCVLHPVATLLSTSRIEYSKGDFSLHLEAHTPSVIKVEEAVAGEMAALVEALGGEVAIAKAWVRKFSDWNQTIPVEHHVAGPCTLKDRYITEDVAYGLVPMSQLGGKLGVNTPVMDALIQIASVINEEDYGKAGRTLETLGLAKLNKEQIIQFVEEGRA